MLERCVFIVTGEHPDRCIGGSELQAYLLAKSLTKYFGLVCFCTTFSKKSGVKEESENLIHIALKSRHFLRKVIDFIRKFVYYKPQIVYVRCLYSFWWLNLLVKFFRIPIVFHLSGDSQTSYANILQHFTVRNLLKNFYLWNTRYSDIIIAQTETQANLYYQSFNRRPEVLYNSQSPNLKPLLKEYSIIKIIWIGKAFKNPEKFIELFFAMKHKFNYEFYMVGVFGAEQIKQFLSLANKYANFTFLGELSREEVDNYLNSSHVLINTSDIEGFPNTFIEAWQRGVIVISDKVNPDNVLTNNRIGFVCKSIDSIVASIERLFSDDLALAKEYSIRAMEYALKAHNIDINIDKLFSIIKKLLPENAQSNISQF